MFAGDEFDPILGQPQFPGEESYQGAISGPFHGWCVQGDAQILATQPGHAFPRGPWSYPDPQVIIFAMPATWFHGGLQGGCHAMRGHIAHAPECENLEELLQHRQGGQDEQHGHDGGDIQS